MPYRARQTNAELVQRTEGERQLAMKIIQRHEGSGCVRRKGGLGCDWREREFGGRWPRMQKQRKKGVGNSTVTDARYNAEHYGK